MIQEVTMPATLIGLIDNWADTEKRGYYRLTNSGEELVNVVVNLFGKYDKLVDAKSLVAGFQTVAATSRPKPVISRKQFWEWVDEAKDMLLSKHGMVRTGEIGNMPVSPNVPFAKFYGVTEDEYEPTT